MRGVIACSEFYSVFKPILQNRGNISAISLQPWNIPTLHNMPECGANPGVRQCNGVPESFPMIETTGRASRLSLPLSVL